MIQLNKRHTAQYLKVEVMKCLAEYNIDISQIYSNTTDNGANVVKVSKLLQELQEENLLMAEEEDELTNANSTYKSFESQISSVFSVVRCAAHTIQLAAYDVIGVLQSQINDVRDVAKKIRTNLRTGNRDISLPCLDNSTRWNSTYDMITSILGLKDYINDLDDCTNISIDWTFVERFATAFKPLAECTTHMQKEQYVIGDFFRDWLKCELDLNEIMNSNKYANDLHHAMGLRKCKLLQHDAFVAALYVDPRFNFQGTPLLTINQKNTAMVYLNLNFLV